MNPQAKTKFPTWEAVKLSADWFSFYTREQGPFPYRQDGSDWCVAGLCPFHSDDKPGSFKINHTSGNFKCFACGAGGNAVSFAMKKYDLTTAAAMRYVTENGAP